MKEVENKNKNEFITPDNASDGQEIHVMPEKFLPNQSNGGTKKLLIIIIVVIGVLIIAAGGYLLYRSQSGQINYYLANVNTNSNQNSNSNANLNSNTNLNQNNNINTNSNSNNNSNQNDNSNTNSNSNNNSNQNGNSNVNGNTNRVDPANINFDFGIRNTIPNSLDTDEDELTDAEEILFGTTKTLPDTDVDTFIDGEEVASGHNPVGKGDLVDSNLVEAYQNTKFSYQVIYPTDWVVQALTETNNEVIFSSPSGEFVEVIVVANPNKLSAKSWYLNQVPKASSSQLKSATVAGLAGVKCVDGYSYYVASDDKVYGIIHNVGTQKEADFRTTFLMIVNSFALVEEE